MAMLNIIVRSLHTQGKNFSQHNGLFARLTLNTKSGNISKANAMPVQRFMASSTSQLDKDEISTSSRAMIEKACEGFLEKSRNGKKEQLFQPYKHTFHTQRDNILLDVIDGMDHWMKLSDEDIKFVKKFSYMTYEAVTMIDDWTDGTELRRGIPSTHKIFGDARTVVCSIAVILSLFEKVQMKKPEALSYISKYLLQYFSGVNEQLCYNINKKCPTKEVYCQIAIEKYSPFHLLIIQLMQSFSNCKKDFTRFGILFGFLSSLTNDIINFSRDRNMIGKVFAEDIETGNLSMPIILAVEEKSLDADVVSNIIRQKPTDFHSKDYCLSLIEKLGGIKKSCQIESEVYKLLLEEIENLGGNPEIVGVVETLYRRKYDEILLE